MQTQNEAATPKGELKWLGKGQSTSELSPLYSETRGRGWGCVISVHSLVSCYCACVVIWGGSLWSVFRRFCGGGFFPPFWDGANYIFPDIISVVGSLTPAEGYMDISFQGVTVNQVFSFH